MFDCPLPRISSHIAVWLAGPSGVGLLSGTCCSSHTVARRRWVRSLAFDPSNEWFCTGSADRTIKIWDVATGQLKLTLTGHIEQASCRSLVGWSRWRRKLTPLLLRYNQTGSA